MRPSPEPDAMVLCNLWVSTELGRYRAAASELPVAVALLYGACVGFALEGCYRLDILARMQVLGRSPFFCSVWVVEYGVDTVAMVHYIISALSILLKAVYILSGPSRSGT